jgi:glutaredoxin 3
MSSVPLVLARINLQKTGKAPMTARVEIYTKPTCPYCLRAKELLRTKKVTFEETDIAAHPERRDEMIKRADGRTTVPQIFINGQAIGGCDDLHALDAKGGLDLLLV